MALYGALEMKVIYHINTHNKCIIITFWPTSNLLTETSDLLRHVQSNHDNNIILVPPII